MAIALRGALDGSVAQPMRDPNFDAQGYGEHVAELFGRTSGMPMSRIVMVVIGSRGDVAPLTGVGVRLQQAGHDVVLATYAEFGKLVSGCGLAFRELDSARVDSQSADVNPVAGLRDFVSPAGQRAIGDNVIAALWDEPADVLLLLHSPNWPGIHSPKPWGCQVSECDTRGRGSGCGDQPFWARRLCELGGESVAHPAQAAQPGPT